MLELFVGIFDDSMAEYSTGVVAARQDEDGDLWPVVGRFEWE